MLTFTHADAPGHAGPAAADHAEAEARGELLRAESDRVLGLRHGQHQLHQHHLQGRRHRHGGLESFQ